MHFLDIILILITLASLLVLITMFMSLFVWVPYVPTPNVVVQKMIDLAKIKGTETVYDLGCGDARILIEAKKRYPGITAIGYELPIGVWLLAKVRVFLARTPATIHLGNYFRADLSDADIIFVYLLPEVMPKLKAKLDAELKPGTTVISHGFDFKEKKPLIMERCELPAWHILRPPKKKGPRVFVYQW